MPHVFLWSANNDSVQFLPVELHAAAATVGKVVSGRSARAAHEGPVLVIAEPVKGTARFQLVRPMSSGGTVVPLGEVFPVSLHVVGTRTLVGSRGFVACVDLSRGSIEKLCSTKGHAEKTYDFFLRDGDRIVAVDDFGMPFWADALRVAGDGSVQYEETWSLPSVTNGHYRGGVLAGSALFLLSEWGIQSGDGHTIHRRDVGVFGQEASIGEIRHRSPKLTSLLAGDRFTRIQGLVVLGDRLLLGAGQRGVLSLPADFEHGGFASPPKRSAGALLTFGLSASLARRSTVTRLDIGGECVDIVRRQERAYALVRAADGMHLVTLSGEAEIVEKTADLKLDGSWSGFVAGE